MTVTTVLLTLSAKAFFELFDSFTLGIPRAASRRFASSHTRSAIFSSASDDALAFLVGLSSAGGSGVERCRFPCPCFTGGGGGCTLGTADPPVAGPGGEPATPVAADLAWALDPEAIIRGGAGTG